MTVTKGTKWESSGVEEKFDRLEQFRKLERNKFLASEFVKWWVDFARVISSVETQLLAEGSFGKEEEKVHKYFLERLVEIGDDITEFIDALDADVDWPYNMHREAFVAYVDQIKDALDMHYGPMSPERKEHILKEIFNVSS